MASAGEPESSPVPQQEVQAEAGATISGVIQALITGKITGDVHIGNNIYARSEFEELNEYIARAVAAYEARMYQALRQPPASGPPYKSLYSFALEDAQSFFGRDAAVQELYEKVVNSRLVVMHARSGDGKTSLLNAGLSPHLIREALLPVYVRIRPYKEDPVEEIKRAIAPPSLGPWPKLLAGLPLQEFLGMISHHLSRQTRGLVLIFDQFDQFIISLPEREVRLPFILNLRDCYEDGSLPVRFIIALRGEQLSDLDELRRYVPEIMQTRYELPPMAREEAKEAIARPLSLVQNGISIEPALLDILIDDLGGRDLELTHLQIVCSRLYEALPEGQKVISVALYESQGRAAKILTLYLDDTLSTLPPYKQSMARAILKELVSSQATNRVLGLSDLVSVIPPDVSQVEDVLKYLVDNRLLRRAEAVDEKEYELANTYLAGEVLHWVGRDELDNKKAQELLQRELANWRVLQTRVDETKLDFLQEHIAYLKLDHEARELLVRSALGQGHKLSFWLAQAEDKEAAVKEVASNLLVAPKPLRDKIGESLKTELDAGLRPNLLASLWTDFNPSKGKTRRNIAEILWILKSWLSMEEVMRVVPILAPAWALHALVFRVLPAAAVVLIIWQGWAFFSRERPVIGQWISIPAGSFTMGMDDQERARAFSLCQSGIDQDPSRCTSLDGLIMESGRQAKAALPQYAILDNEVTNAQYQLCVDKGGCKSPVEWRQNYDKKKPNLPATNLSWFEAGAYCKWLGGRLPTEGEWEKAARGPNNFTFPWGKEWDASKANLEHHHSGGGVQSVLTFASTDISGYGVKNMAGNVQEWTASAGLPIQPDQVFTNDVLVLAEDSPNWPVDVRGGSWINERSQGMAAKRETDGILNSDSNALNRRETLGFRCVCPNGRICASPWTWQWSWLGR